MPVSPGASGVLTELSDAHFRAEIVLAVSQPCNEPNRIEWNNNAAQVDVDSSILGAK